MALWVVMCKTQIRAPSYLRRRLLRCLLWRQVRALQSPIVPLRRQEQLRAGRDVSNKAHVPEPESIEVTVLADGSSVVPGQIQSGLGPVPSEGQGTDVADGKGGKQDQEGETGKAYGDGSPKVGDRLEMHGKA
eukprot:6179383-Pleurochrysis_carterae.AAC.1